MDTRNLGFTTAAIHAGRIHNPTDAVVTPVFQTSVFSLEGRGEGGGGTPGPVNPNISEVEAVLAAFEAADKALVTGSGMAAIATVLDTFLRPGDHVVVPAALYTGTEQLLRRWEETRDLKLTWIRDTLDLGEWEAAIRRGAAMVFVESPSNPALAITDIAAVASLAKNWGSRVVADNTFATPAFTRPLELGCDLSLSSATKYLGGHSDLLGGVIAGSEADIAACRNSARLTGLTLDPMAAWLLHRGLKTFHLRIRRACDTAQSLAQWLLWQPQVSRVDYPGLQEHPGHAVAARQMNGSFGAVLGFELQGGLDASRRFCEALEIIRRGVGLGGVESLIQHPATMSHASASPEVTAALRITEGLLRYSVGIEDITDLKDDLERGLQAATLMR